MLQPKARTTTDTSKGASTTSSRMERHGLRMRLSTYASGAPMATQISVTSPAIQNVRQKIAW